MLNCTWPGEATPSGEDPHSDAVRDAGTDDSAAAVTIGGPDWSGLLLLRNDASVDLTFEFPMRDDRDTVRAELNRQGFETSTPLSRIGDENYLEVSGVADQRQALRVEEIVHRVSRASRRVPNDHKEHQ